MKKMKNIIFSSTLSFIFFGCISNINHDDLGLVPQPTYIERVSGKTILDDDWTIKHNGDHIDLNTLKNILTEHLNKDHKVKLNDDADKVISLIIKSDDTLRAGGYKLNINNDEINIMANSPNGIF